MKNYVMESDVLVVALTLYGVATALMVGMSVLIALVVT